VALAELATWDDAGLEAAVRAQAEAMTVKLGQIAQPLRAALTGSTASPGLFEVMAVLGRDEVLGRLADVEEAPEDRQPND
jgi:glutamyl-tRNA synthetase